MLCLVFVDPVVDSGCKHVFRPSQQRGARIEGEDGVCLEEKGKAVVLVTGSNGYVGSHIVRALLEEG